MSRNPQPLATSVRKRPTTALAALAWLLPSLALASGGCGSGNPGTPSTGAPSAETTAVAMFVFERQRDLTSFVLNSQYVSPTQATFYTLDDVTGFFGATENSQKRLQAFLVQELATTMPGATPAAQLAASQAFVTETLEVDPTYTFATIALTEAQVQAVFPTEGVGGIWENTPPVPATLTSDVTHVLGNFTTFQPWTPATTPPKPPARASGTSPGAWDAYPWAMGSGTPPACPSIPDAHCYPDVYPGPQASFRTFFPSQLRTAYEVPPTLTGAGMTAAVVIIGENVDATRVDAYAGAVGSPFLSAKNLTQSSVGGGPAPPVEDSEALLDVETLIGMAPDIEHISVISGPGWTSGLMQPGPGFLMAMAYTLAAALDTANTNGEPPDLITMSWGGGEYGFVQDPLAFQAGDQAVSGVLATAAAMGITVVVATGDSGPTATFLQPGLPSALSTSYPATSPLVTAVGGTNLQLDAANAILASGTWNDSPLDATSFPPGAAAGATGGGNSLYFERPPWQVAAGVPGALRALPDIAAFADGYPGMFTVSSDAAGNGTSIATPMLGALMLLLKQHLVEAKKATSIGLATPLLYAMAQQAPVAFRDITQGNSTKPGGPNTCCFAGAGYDLATGWGSLRLSEAITAWDLLYATASSR